MKFKPSEKRSYLIIIGALCLLSFVAIYNIIDKEGVLSEAHKCPDFPLAEHFPAASYTGYSYQLNSWLISKEPLSKVELKIANTHISYVDPIEDPAYLAPHKYAGCGGVRAYRINGMVDLALLSADNNELEIFSSSGKTKKLATLDIKAKSPFGYIENVEPIDRINNAINGWAISAAGPLTIRVITNGKTIAETQADISRKDVASVYKKWPDAERSGFSVAIPFSELAPGKYPTQIELIGKNGHSHTLDGPVINNDQSFALVESVSKSIRLGDKNILSGWAVSKTGAASVRIKAQGAVISTINVDGNRSDVGRVFKHWDYADRSGFQWLVPYRDLPRGRYPLLLEFVEGKEVFQESLGPEVHNSFPVGRVIADVWQLNNPEKIEVSAWVADEDGIASVELSTEGGHRNFSMSLIKPEVTYDQVRRADESEMGIPSTALEKGALYRGQLDPIALNQGLNRLLVKVVDKSGEESLLPGPLVLTGNSSGQPCEGKPVRLYFPGDTSFWRKKAPQLQELRKLFGKGCIEVGMQSRVEYLRTTKGKEQDYQFDPDFSDDQRIRKEGVMLSTALNELLGYADEWNLPLMVTLDGGVWADSAFSAPDVDIVDALELEDHNVQWNQFGKSESDDALSDLPGSFGSPELARMMSLNWYNEEFHFYKKRNLTAAVKTIRDSAFVKSGGQVSINLDPDQYINPWFYKVQWYDYNPDTLRQFREWLLHEGLYSDKGALSGQGVPSKLTLTKINQIAKKNWIDVEQIDPPRKTLNYQDSWHQLWTQFKRHLIDVHYDQLSVWATAAGMPSSRLYTSQTFIQTDVAETLFDEATGWPDEAGVSIEGAKASHGHLGAILYGAASRDEGMSRSGGSMFSAIQKIDPKWGVVELNPATIAFPEWVAGHEASYKTVRNILNAGAQFLTPMWGSHMADLMTYPDTFRSYDAFTGTPFEFQLVWWLLHRQDIPAGGVSFPFGNDLVLSADGWSAQSDTKLQTEYGRLVLAGENKITLFSPKNINVSTGDGAKIKLQGQWCSDAKVQANLKLSDGSVSKLQITPDQTGFLGQISEFKSLSLVSLALEWDLSSCESPKEIILENLSIVPPSKH